MSTATVEYLTQRLGEQRAIIEDALLFADDSFGYKLQMQSLRAEEARLVDELAEAQQGDPELSPGAMPEIPPLTAVEAAAFEATFKPVPTANIDQSALREPRQKMNEARKVLQAYVIDAGVEAEEIARLRADYFQCVADYESAAAPVKSQWAEREARRAQEDEAEEARKQARRERWAGMSKAEVVAEIYPHDDAAFRVTIMRYSKADLMKFYA